MQVLLQSGAKVEFEPNPFASEGGEELAAVAYRCVRLAVQGSLEGLIAKSMLVIRACLQSLAVCARSSSRIVQPKRKPTVTHQPRQACKLPQASCDAPERRYRKFALGSDVELVVRCELDGVMNYKGQDQLLSIKALNEFDPKHTGASINPPPALCFQTQQLRSKLRSVHASKAQHP